VSRSSEENCAKFFPDEPLALVVELPCLDKPIKLDPMMVSALDLCVHYIIVDAFSMQSGLIYVGVSCSAISEVFNNGGKYGRRRSTLSTRCMPRKGGVFSSK
jgi:hypothetical protein